VSSINSNVRKRDRVQEVKMSQAAVECLLGRIITDSEIRMLAIRSPAAASQALGLNLSDSEICCLVKLDFDLLGLVTDTIDDAICRSAVRKGQRGDHTTN
jgi:hypothetical protein